MKVSVILPVYDSKDIVWLAMESLCNQETSLPWELIIFEEQKGAAGSSFYRQYKKRLKNAGMERFVYTQILRRKCLVNKILDMVKQCRGEYIAKHDADNYHEQFWIDRVLEMDEENADVWSSSDGYFYNINNNDFVRFHVADEKVHLAEIYNKRVFEGVEPVINDINTDVRFFERVIDKKGGKKINGLTSKYLYTDGFGKVCNKRKYRYNTQNIDSSLMYWKTNNKLEGVVPEKIADKLKAMTII